MALDARDPVGAYLNQACREAGVDLDAVATVQTYHAALALAHHGLGIAIIDSFTAASADLTRVRVVKLAPSIPIPIRALRAAQAPDSLVARAMVKAFLSVCKS